MIVFQHELSLIIHEFFHELLFLIICDSFTVIRVLFMVIRVKY